MNSGFPLLEENLGRLIQKIVQIQNAHKATSGEAALRSRDWEFVFSEFDGWIILYCSTAHLGGYWIYPMLYPLNRIALLEQQLPDYSPHPPSAAYNAQEDWIEPYWNGENSQDFANFKFI